MPVAAATRRAWRRAGPVGATYQSVQPRSGIATRSTMPLTVRPSAGRSIVPPGSAGPFASRGASSLSPYCCAVRMRRVSASGRGPERAVLPGGLARQEDDARRIGDQDPLAGPPPLALQVLEIDLDHHDSGDVAVRRGHRPADEQTRLLRGGADPEIARGTGRHGVAKIGR